MGGKVWIKYSETKDTRVCFGKPTLRYVTKSFVGPFDSYLDAVVYLEKTRWEGAEIYDFT